MTYVQAEANLRLPEPGKNNQWYKYTDSQTVIVFVHGVLADSRSCWHSKGLPPEYWPHLVTSDERFENVSVFLSGYYTAADSKKYGIRPAADELFSALKRVQKTSDPPVTPPILKQNIIFVCHSTGGIVVRHMLVNETDAFRDKNIGLVLIASPSAGSHWADLVRVLTYIYGNEAIEQLQQNHWTSRELNAQFKNLIHDHRIPNLIGVEAYENHFIFHRKWLPNKFVVVTEDSAGRFFGASTLLRKTDHFSSVKPDGYDHPAHELLVDFYHDFKKAFVSQTKPPSSIGGSTSDSKTVSLTDKDNAKSAIGTGLAPSADMIAALPEIDPHFAFVGREDLMRDFRGALSGISSYQGVPGRDPSGTEVRAIWLDGPGGIGKSSFLRRACLDAQNFSETRAKVGFVDFDVLKPDWHRPGFSRLIDPRELFDAIAYRLAKLFGRDALGSYWETRGAVEQGWTRHTQLRRQLDDAFKFLASSETDDDLASRSVEQVAHPLAKRDALHVDRVRWVERYLEEAGRWPADKDQRKRTIIEVQRQLSLFDQPNEDVFSKFAVEFWPNEPRQILQPCRLIADALQQTVRLLCRSSPIVMAFDTCEDIPRQIETWLQYLLIPLLDGSSRLLVLIASQHRPHSWLDHVDRVRFRNAHLSLSRDGRFSLADITKALSLADIDLSEAANLPTKIQRITAGMPVAVGAMIDLYKEDPTMMLDDLDEGQADDPDDSRANQTALRIVAKRLVRRLEGQQTEQRSFRDILALTILMQADLDILAGFWAPENPRVRLRDLEERYTLLAGGNIQPDIRRFLREFWRQQAPEQLSTVVRDLSSVVDHLLSEQTANLETRIQWRIERLNLLFWQFGEEALPEAAKCLVACTLAEIGTSDVTDLVLELRPLKRRWRAARTLFEQNQFLPDNRWTDEFTSWTLSQSTGWSEGDSLGLKLLVALNKVDGKKFEEAVTLFTECLQYYADHPPLPLRQTAVDSYTSAVVALGQQRIDVAERAVRLLEKVGVERDDDWDDQYYRLLHDAAMYKEAEDYCRRARIANPIDHSPLIFLSHILGVHLDRLDEAVSVLKEALVSEPDNINLNYFLAGLYLEKKEYSEAESAYKRTLSAPEHLLSGGQRSRVLAALADLYLRHMSRPEDARRLLAEAVEKCENIITGIRQISEVFLLDKDFLNAERFARRAVELNPEISNVFLLAEVLATCGKWREARESAFLWLTKTSGVWIRENWSSALRVLRLFVSHGYAAELGSILLERKADRALHLLGLALSNEQAHDPLATELRRHLIESDIISSDAKWPNV